jgi:hypothetical protein
MTCPQSKFGKSDTTPEAQRMLYDIYRRMPLGRKLKLVFEIYDAGQWVIRTGLRTLHPGASEEEIWHLWARQHLGDKLYEEVYGSRSNLRPSKGRG